MNKIALLKGGLNSENEVSLKTAEACLFALKELKYEIVEIDIKDQFISKIINSKVSKCFNALHGSLGENGSIPGLLNCLKIPYTHSGVMASSIAINKKLTKEILLERLELISSGMFKIIFTGQKITTPIEDSYVKVKKLSKKRVRKPKTYSAKYTRLSLGFSSILIIAGLGIGIYAMQQVYFTDIQYQASQQALEQVYTAADDDVEISRTQQPKINERLLSIFNDVPVFESLSDTLLDNINANAVDYSPDVFGQLEIASINLSQFIVSGTDEQSLEFGPGHYMQTALPGTGGNVGIAGHRTTFGAPFAKLDQVQIGDELILTVDSKKFHYVVDEVRIVEAIGGEYVLYNRGDDRLTLTTCHPRYSAKQRLVVTGILTRIEAAN